MIVSTMRMAIRLRWAIVVFWVLCAAASIAFLTPLSRVVRNDTASFLPSNAPSVVASRLAGPLMPSSGTTGELVASNSFGSLTTSDLGTIKAVESQALRSPFVTSISNGVVSSDGDALLANVRFASTTDGGGSAGRRAVTAIRKAMAAHDDPGLSMHLTGALPILVDQQAAAARTEALVVVASVVLIITLLAIAFRAVLAPLVALAPAGIALAVAGPVIAESTHIGIQISSLLALLLSALVLGAGTDYGLFLLFRYRENLRRGLAPAEAIVAAGARVGTSITFSALTVISALLSLLLASFGLYRGVGPGLAIGIAVVLVVELTLLPALLSIVGPRLFWPSLLSRRGSHGGWGRVAARVAGHPIRSLTVGVVLLGGLSAFLAEYAPSGFDPGSAIVGSDSSLGQTSIEEHFGEIAVGATDVVLRFTHSVWDRPAVLAQAQDELWASQRFTSVTGALQAGGLPLTPQAIAQLFRVLGPPQRLPLVPETTDRGFARPLYDAYRAESQYVTENGRTVLYQTSLRAGSAGTTAAMQAIPGVRAVIADVARSVGATRWGAAGQAPGAADVSNISGEDVVRILPVVALVLGLLLGLLLRSVIAPLYLVASVVLSYTASLGLTVLIFVTVGGQLGINFTLPFFMFVFIMALGEDYNILVMSRIKEESAILPLRVAVPRAVATTGTTVTTAGLILAGTFGILAVTTSGQVHQIGTGLALGILLDTFLVRTLLVPSTAVLVGRWNWWPLRPWTELGTEGEREPTPVTRTAELDRSVFTS